MDMITWELHWVSTKRIPWKSVAIASVYPLHSRRMRSPYTRRTRNITSPIRGRSQGMPPKAVTVYMTAIRSGYCHPASVVCTAPSIAGNSPRAAWTVRRANTTPQARARLSRRVSRTGNRGVPRRFRCGLGPLDVTAIQPMFRSGQIR